MREAISPLVGSEIGSSSLVLHQLASRFRTMAERENDPRLRHKLAEMSADYERQAKLQDA
jgi:hypothetical protein